MNVQRIFRLVFFTAIIGMVICCAPYPSVKSNSQPGYEIGANKVMIFILNSETTVENLESIDSIIRLKGNDYNISFSENTFVCTSQDANCQKKVFENCNDDLMLIVSVAGYTGTEYAKYWVKYSSTLYDCPKKLTAWKNLTNVPVGMRYKVKFVKALLEDAEKRNIINRRVEDE